MSKNPDNALKERHKLLFGVRRSIRYHHRRTVFFDRLHKISTFLSALAGTATVASVLAKAPSILSITFAAAVAIFSVIDLVFGTAQSARLHNDLARRFIALEKTLISLDSPTEKDITEMTARRLDIETDEPPPLKVLDSMCHNELLRAMGYDKNHYLKIGWFQRRLAQFVDLGEHKIMKPPAPNPKSAAT